MALEMKLDGRWEALPVSRFDGDYDTVDRWVEVPVPGHWQEAPELKEHTGKTVYKNKFKFMPEPDKRFFLRVNGAFYWSTFYVNDARLGSNEGYFFPHEYEVTGLLRKENTLIAELDCPDEKDKLRKRQLTGVFHHWDCIDPETNPGGIWLPVEIHSSGPVRLSDPFFTTVYLGKDGKSARISGRVTFQSEEPARIKTRITFTPRTFQGEEQIFEKTAVKARGAVTFYYNLDLEDPALWWTHDHGRPDLYDLKVEVFIEGEEKPSDVWQTGFGVRTIQMRDYIAYLNGRRMYIRGNNYPPGDTRLSTMNRERAEKDVDLAIGLNLNMLRVHAHVDHPEFYRACDEKGMLLWQDFPMQWYYRPEVEAQALRQVEKMVLTLGSRPSIAVWCMHNEPIEVADTRKLFRPTNILRFAFSAFIWNKNRDRMDRRLAGKARFIDPWRFVTRCSGERGLCRETGDVHYYYGWYFGPLRWFHKKYEREPDKLKFITEFGSQSLPNVENAVRFMADRLEDVDWKKLERRHHLQKKLLHSFVDPKKHDSLESYVEATQDYQSKLNRFYIDRLRALKYKPGGGCVAFVLLDSNPAVQWSPIDYWRLPKKSYHAMKKAMSPVYAFTVLPPARNKPGNIIKVPVYAVNDRFYDVDVTVGLQVKNPVGEVFLEEVRDVTLPADCEALAVMNPELRLGWSGKYVILITLDGPDGRLDNRYHLSAR